ncbi:MAG: hypothetical protein J7498_02050 [Sphingobium sp.]|nr:hypothetical protein [Sphingobium sp.]
MYVIAGLPIAIHRDAVANLQARLPQAIVKGNPAPSLDGALYSPAAVNQIVRSVGEFTVRRRTNGNAQPAPSSITLLFVPAPDQENLLQRVDFAVMSAPLPTLIALDEHYKQLRHDRDAVADALRTAVAASGEARMNLNRVVERLSRRSDNEALLLPPRNFMTPEGNLVPAFTAIRRGDRTWADRLEDVGPIPLTHEDVPKRIQPSQTRRVFVDDRGMAFFIAHPTAYDGPPREIEDGDSTDELLGALRTLYRFGGAIEPGLHHDVQRRDGSSLDGALFDCSKKGRINANAQYANIYPNDFVRVGDFKAAE